MSSVKRNIVANYLGSAWSALMGLALVPVYIKYLGIESYGLIGVFALIQAWLVLIDMGLAPALGRELAGVGAGTHTAERTRDLVRSVEILYVVIGAAIALAVITAAPWLATHWLKVDKLPTSTVANALAIVGAVIALRWLSGLYSGAISAMQRQVWLSSCTAIFATLRGAGVIAVLAWVSPTIQAFFSYQAVVTALEVSVLAIEMRRSLPKASRPARFSWIVLRQVWRFAAAVSAITFLSLLLTQLDKLLLSKLLPLTEFGYYALASTIAGALFMLVAPLNTATYPRLIELVARGDREALAGAYHRFSQMMTLTIAPAAVVLSLFSEHVLLLWMRDPAITAAVAPLVSLLAIGTMLNGLMHTPYSLQLAHGYTRLSIATNAVSVVVLVPTMYVAVGTYGARGAACVWIALNLGYAVIALPLMHRVLLRSEMWRWYRQDVLIPLGAILAAAAAVRLVAPAPLLETPLANFIAVGAAAVATVASAVVVTPLGRYQLARCIRLQRAHA